MSRIALHIPFVLVATFAVACASPSSTAVSAPTGATQHAAPPKPERFFVWTRDDHAGPTTFTLDGQGHVLSTDAGVRLAARGAVWAYRAQTREVALEGCPDHDDQGNELPTRTQGNPGKLLHATLDRLDSEEVLELVPEGNHDGLGGFDEGAEVVATVGPYLFLKTSTWVYGCGAHGSTGVSADVWDVERGAPLFGNDREKLAAYLPADVIADLRARAEAAFPNDEVFRDKDGKLPVELTEIVPSYGPEGALELDARFTAPACYACSDGAWSSYSQSTLERIPAIPRALAAWASPPDAVKQFLKEHPGVTVGGWSGTQ